MEPTTQRSIRSARVPGIVWAALAIVAAGVGSVLIFGVPMDRALAYGFLGLMILAHFFMHAGHGAHGGHSQARSSGPDSQPADGSDDHRSHGGCH